MKTQQCPTANIQICENKFVLNNKGKIKGNVTYIPSIQCNLNPQPEQPQTPEDQTVVEPIKYNLNVTTSGSGTVTVKDSGGNVMSANTANFTISINSGWDVYLTATANEGSNFTGWSGAASGTDSQFKITMDTSKSVTATFVIPPPPQYALTVNTSGPGTVTVKNSGETVIGTINSNNPTYSGSFDTGTTLKLSAFPDASSEFEGWSDGISVKTTPVTVTMNNSKSITAKFNKKQTPQPGETPKKSNPFDNLPKTAKVAAIVASVGILIAIIMYILHTLTMAKTVAAVV
jgi:hypothetical protein